MTEDRVAALEQRVAQLEARLGISVAQASMPIASAASASGAVAEQVTSAAPSAATVEPPTVEPPPARRRNWTIDEQLSTRLLAWAGGSALILGVLFFLSLAFSRGWIGPEGRVLIGLAAGASGLIAGAWLFERRHGTPALVTIGVGIGTSSLAVYAATQLYGLVPAEMGLAWFAILAVVTAGIAVRSNSQAVAVFGLVAVAAGPIIVRAPASLSSLLFVAAVVVGTAMLGVFRSWAWPQTLVVILTAVQIDAWLAGVRTAPIAVVVIAGYWAVNILGASGAPRNFAVRGRLELPSIHAGSAAIVVMVSLFSTVWLRLVFVDEPFLRVVALAGLVLAHGLVAVPLLIRSRLRDPFGLFVAAAGLGILAITVALDAGGAYQPLANIAIATALAWTSIRLRHRLTGIAAGMFASFALLHVVFVEYRVERTSGWPFFSPEGGVIAFAVLAVLFVAGAAAQSAAETASERRASRWTPRAAWSVGITAAAGILVYASAFEFLADGQVIACGVLAVGMYTVARMFDSDEVGVPLLVVAASLVELVAALVAVTVVAPPDRLAVDASPHAGLVPVLNLTSVGLAVIAAGFVTASRLRERATRWLIDGARWRAGTIALAAIALVYLGSVALVDGFQVRVVAPSGDRDVATQAQVALSIAWVVTGAIVFGIGLARRWGNARALGLGLLALATLKVFLFDLSALDVSYRVLSFLGIGLVLLVSSFLASRFHEGPAPEV